MRTEPTHSQRSSNFSVQSYLKAGLAFMATTTTYFVARTSGLLPTWFRFAAAADTLDLTRDVTVAFPESSSLDATEIKANQRQLLQINSTVTVINPIPDQVIEATVEYSYDLSAVFSGDYDQLRIYQTNGSALPNWLSYEPKRVGGYDTPGVSRAVQVIGTVAYVADYGSGLQILDVSNPAAVIRLGGYDTPGYAYDVQVIGLVAYVADEAAGLQILDVSNPINVTRLGGYDTPGYAFSVQVIGPVAYVADENAGLQILDVSNPANVTRLGGYVTSNPVRAVQVIGPVAYVADGGLQILNVSNPANVTRLGFCYMPLSTFVGVQVIGTVAYVANSNLGLQILNVSNPAAVIPLGGYDTPGYAYGVQVIGLVAYVTDDTAGLQILDVSNPAVVTRLSGYDTPGAARAVQVIGTVAYVADWDSGLQILDLRQWRLLGTATAARVGEVTAIEVSAWSAGQRSASESFQLKVGRLPRRVDTSLAPQSVFPGDTLTLSWDSDTLFSDASGSLLRLSESLTNLTTAGLLSASILLRPTFLSSYDTPSAALSVQVIGTVAYVADWESGLQILDVSNPAAVTRLGGYNTSGLARAVQVIGPLAYVADDTAGLQILNVSNPANVIRLGGYNTPGYAFSVQVIGTVAYVADYDAGLQILNVNNPAGVIRLGGYNTTGFAYDVQVIGPVAYVVDDDSGLQILNVSNPAAVTRLGGYNTPGYARDVQVIGMVAYVADYTSGFQILNVSNPAAVTRLGGYNTTGSAGDVQVIGPVSYVADGFSGLQILDISNPAAVTRLGGYDTPSAAWAVQVIGTVAYVADYYSGLQILDLTTWEWTVTPTAAEVGNYEVTLTATNDLGGSVSDHFLLRVEGPPQINGTIPFQYARVGQGFNYFLPQNLVSDPNLDPISFSAQRSGNQSLPAWLFFNGISATFSGTPQNGDTGNLTIVITATDNIAGSASISFGLYVDHVPTLNRPIGQRVVGVGVPFNFTLPSDTFVDLDQDVLLYNVTRAGGGSLPAWLTVNPSTLRFSGIANSSALGTELLAVTARDPVGNRAADTLSLVVEYFPVVGQPIIATVAGVGRPYTLTVPSDSFTDADDPVLSLSATQSSGDRLPSWLSFNPSTHQFSGVPTDAAAGLLSLRVMAQDSYGASASSDFSLRISHVPQVVQPIPEQLIAIDAPYQYTIPSGTFSDADGDVLTYQLLAAAGETLPGWLRINTTSLTLSGTPNITLSHTYRLQVVATDPYGLATSTEFALNADHFPELVAPLPNPSVLGVDEPFQWPLPAGAFLDRDGETLSYRLLRGDGGPAPGQWGLNPVTGLLSGTPSVLDLGNTTLRIVARDSYGAEAFGVITLQVAYSPQVAQPLPTLPSLREGRWFNFTIPSNTFIDQDDAQLRYTVYLNNQQPLPIWLLFSNQTLQLSGTPELVDVGTYELSVVATDHLGASAQTPLSLQVNANTPPEVHSLIAAQVVNVGQSYRFVIPSDVIIDRNDDPLTYTLTTIDVGPLPRWLHFEASRRELSGTPGRSDVEDFGPREFELKYSAKDDRASTSTLFHMTVQGESSLQLFLRVGAPLITVATLLFAAYRNRALLINCYKPQRYQRLEQTLTIGEPFEHELATPAENIKRLHVRLPQTDRSGWSCGSRFFPNPLASKYRDLPNGFILPSWMEYDMERNVIRSKGVVPPLEDKAMVVKVKGDAGVILEEFSIRVLPANAVEFGPEQAQAVTTGSSRLRDTGEGVEEVELITVEPPPPPMPSFF